ncbi:ferric reductase [Angomonas deanei]|uniref:Ferric reductase like transmembrane component/FAD-binding domain containing protein, putative n=1 Tax=Angomonas deanei TaxID=59799 RepID=A0A7G2CI42_9TRYP|nr:ferric reductase [Angomonas deanei]CAD2219530.1 Ferric reductase like transmembrane component/FAD-binding domain containing protein, putative [Angomonas deanei]|eukprot:EPY32017.1 ferric reductase [Angomonas deanei]
MSVLFLFSGIGFSMFLSTLSSTTPAARRFLRFISPLPVRTGVAVVLLTLFGIVTFYIPNSWEFFVAARIANNAHLIASTSHETCLDWRNYTCPELPWSLMKTKNVFVSENLVLKLYPSNLIFFSYLFVVVCVGILLKFSKKSRMWTSSPWRCDLTYGELAFSGLTIFATGAFFFYWIHDHNYNDLWDGGDSAGISASERWARAFGQLAVLFLSFLLFPAAKTSFLYSIFQISRENTMWVHKVLGYGMLLATFLHMILWYYFYYENGDFPHDVYAVPLRTSIAKSNFTVPLVSYATWFMFVAVGIFGFWKLRRKFYDIFHMLHLISFTLILPAVLWHAAAGWEYVLPGFCVWLSDKLLSIYRCTEETSIISLTAVSASVAKLSFALTSSQQGGEYVLLNIPEISVVEWHPFSLCNDGHESFVLIKSMGPGTWTGNVLKFATQDTPSKLRLYVDGPCGGENRLDDYEHILFVAGGIGITGCLSLLKKAIQKKWQPCFAVVVL